MNDTSENIIIYLLKKFFYTEKKYTFLLILLSIIINILQVAVISNITAGLINAVQNSIVLDIFKNFKYFIIVSIIYLIINYIYKTIQLKLLSKLRHWLKSELVHIILKINNDNELEQINSIELNTPISRISAASFLVLNNFISYSFPNIILLLVIIAYFTYTNLIYGSIFLLCNLVIIFIIYSRFKIIESSNEIYEQSLNTNENGLIEILNNMERIIQRGQNINETNNFNKKINHTIESSIDFYSKANTENIISSSLLNLTIFINIGYLLNLYLTKQIDIKIFITFFTMLIIYRERFTSMIQNIPDIVEFIGRIENITFFFKNTINDYKNINQLYYKKTNLEFNTISFQNVIFSYTKNDKYILHNFNLDIHLNGLIGILGPSGRGKSTVGKLIIKLYKYTGIIKIDNIDIQTINNNYLRNNIVYIDQFSKLFDRKIIENVLYGCNIENADLYFCKKQLNFICNNFPLINNVLKKIDIYNKNAGLLGNNLSGGQKQVINVINGLIQNAKIIILDEPTNSLDYMLKKEVISLIDHYKSLKKAIIVITHDIDLIKILTTQIKI